MPLTWIIWDSRVVQHFDIIEYVGIQEKALAYRQSDMPAAAVAAAAGYYHQAHLPRGTGALVILMAEILFQPNFTPPAATQQTSHKDVSFLQ